MSQSVTAVRVGRSDRGGKPQNTELEAELVQAWSVKLEVIPPKRVFVSTIRVNMVVDNRGPFMDNVG